MHPYLARQLSAARINDLLTEADETRRVLAARRMRGSPDGRRKKRRKPAQAQAGLASAGRPAVFVPPVGGPDHSADGPQDREHELAGHGPAGSRE
jgi:hypothetical protein